MTAARQSQYHAPTIRFDDWKARIQMAPDLPELVGVVREYLGTWHAADLRELPVEVSSGNLARAEDIVSRAVVATREELMFTGSKDRHHLLNEMAMTLAAAAQRLRGLQSLERRAR